MARMIKDLKTQIAANDKKQGEALETALKNEVAGLVATIEELEQKFDSTISTLKTNIKAVSIDVEQRFTPLTVHRELEAGFNTFRDEVRAQLSALSAPPLMPEDGGAPCSIPGGCPPEIGAVENELSLSALDGSITFQTEKCVATDLCELAMQVRSLLNKFQA